MKKEYPIACAFGVFHADERREYQEIVAKLKQARQSINESAAGFEFTFDGSLETLRQLTEWLNFERRCCPFLTFNLTIDNVESQLRLNITGSEQAIRFVRHEFESKNIL